MRRKIYKRATSEQRWTVSEVQQDTISKYLKVLCLYLCIIIAMRISIVDLVFYRVLLTGKTLLENT